ncbi:MAG: DUF1266 domain-containing protein, partial [Treponema sp.]|nr:DUF1266 domain-containing protein [Treponema sp.]
MKKMISFTLFLFIRLNITAENIDKPVALEIINMPQEYNNKFCLVATAGSQGADNPSVWSRVLENTFSGEFKYEDGTSWKINENEKNVRHSLVLVIVDTDKDNESITKFSRKFLIESDVIILDYAKDFFDTAAEAVRHYAPAANKLPRSRLWALALTGFLTVSNGDQHDLLGFDDINENNKKNYLELLRRDWGVTTREELLKAIQETENDGHAARLKYIKEIIQEILNEKSEFTIITVYNKYHLNSRLYNYLKFVVINWNRYSARTILAWDLGRVIALCRWGYSTGFLTEEEAWEKIMETAGKIQPMYQSWEEFGYDYYMGRIFWASGFGDDINYLIQ